MKLGTLIRCAHMEERRIAFFREIGLNCIQIAGVYEEHLAPVPEAKKASDALFRMLKKYDMAVPSMFLSYPDQDWSNPREGVGLVPARTRAERMLISCRLMEWCTRYQIPSVTCHVGFLPEAGEAYCCFIRDMQQLVKFAGAMGLEFLFETGTETAASLKQVLDDIGEPNTGVNFDPANLLIYNNGDPAELAELLADRIKVIHCKDANLPADGAVMGRETVLGAGSADVAALLQMLIGRGFDGPLIIERELPPGPEQEKDIREAAAWLQDVVRCRK